MKTLHNLVERRKFVSLEFFVEIYVYYLSLRPLKEITGYKLPFIIFFPGKLHLRMLFESTIEPNQRQQEWNNKKYRFFLYSCV